MSARGVGFGLSESRSEARRRILADAAKSVSVIPHDQRDRAICKALVRKGLLVPHRCLGYQLPAVPRLDSQPPTR